ncbi:4-hydroxyphenylpyruvate dioxygenase-like protein [Gonapodya prolifera JEL478]|uniref:4-hydroxyphenylpyruvate dioxygenase n=1 Tax=Gonapodya prolifera (strain JEL478) TaxID=1344416 RepID=A0A139A6I9_GONPJ|nr:4-hydroxyphenylpyruvate dioxygenase-like protein [Gonapodya prolifera JEL478]|eukprot:KXS12344.1 4-hydroxyphenylpyruvate dioxygenase-like protein [Gonapodya prolifera JEL478]
MPEAAPTSKYIGFDHLLFWVGDSKQAASYYITRFGFEPVAYSGLETGSRNVMTHVIAHPASPSSHRIIWAFQSAINPSDAKELTAWVGKHGDGVRDMAFTVSNAEAAWKRAVDNGATSILPPTEKKDENGRVVIATIKAYGEVVHSFIQRDEYKGPFLPGFGAAKPDPLTALLPKTSLVQLDHCVSNMPKGVMEPTVQTYEKWLGFRRFWSVDDSMIHTEYSSLNSIVVCDPDTEAIKTPVNEPASGKKISQIEEYLIYNAGPGVQHIALRTETILETVKGLRERGVNFIQTPDAYYDDLRKRLKAANITIKEDPTLETIQKYKILVDFEPEVGYLLQIFTEPQGERPTLFIEIIQREGHQGFGAGNFKALFEGIELEQARRGNLVDAGVMEYKAM